MRRPKFRASGAGCQNALSSLPRLPPSLLYQKTETEKTNNNNKHESSFELAATHRVYRMLPSVCLTVCLSLSLSPSLSISTTLQTHYKNLFHKISMPAKNDISAARVIDLPKKTKLIRKNVALTHWLTKKFAKYSRIAQNPWVSRCVLHLAMGTASNYGQGEFSTAKRERERVAVLCQPCVFSMCATQSVGCKGILIIENEYII